MKPASLRFEMAKWIEENQTGIELRKILSQTSPTILFGAGISVMSPSNLPTAVTMLKSYSKELLTALNGDSKAVSNFPSFDLWSTDLRFEEVVSIFRRVGMHEESLSPLDGSYLPNLNHKLLAALYSAGWPLYTTNFDILTEIAILESGVPLEQLVYPVDYSNFDGWNAIYKLHGSFWKWDKTTWINSYDSICSTFEDFGLQYARYLSNHPQKMCFMKHIKKAPLVVLGYSGSDDFDIAPLVLSALRDQPLIWVQHVSADDEKLLTSSLDDVPLNIREEGPSELFQIYRNRMTYYLRMDTTAFLSWLVESTKRFSERPPDNEREAPRPKFKYQTFGSAQLVADKFRLYCLCGFLNQELSRFREALYFFDVALSFCSDTKEMTGKLLLLYEIGKTYRVLGEVGDAITNFEECRKGAKACLKSEIEAATLHQIGLCLEDKSFKGAISYYSAALKVANDSDNKGISAFVLRSIGSILWKLKRHQEAYDALIKAHELSEQLGLLEELCQCKMELAILEMEFGRPDKAKLFLADLMELNERMGDYINSAKILHELGIADHYERRLDDAEKHFLESIKISSSICNWKMAALSKFHLAWIAYERDEIELAQKLENESSRVLESEDEYFYAHNLQFRAAIYLRLGEITNARAILRQAIALSEKVGDAINVSNCKSMLESIDEINAIDGKPLRIGMKFGSSPNQG